MTLADPQQAPETTAAASAPRARWKPFVLRQFIQWHWISAAIALVGMLLFAATGITLNHAADIQAAPIIRDAQVVLPQNLQRELANASTQDRQPLPAPVAAWIDQRVGASSAGREAEWSGDEVYLAIARPGGNATITIERDTGAVIYEDTWRGWIAYLNDLHKGRDTGATWAWFIDIFAAACVLFCLTGLGLLWLKSSARPSTWPLIALGVLIPVLLAIFLIH
ncbi:MAG: PepSY-associated TM helix domain-containing protein [Hyphomonadaceae bacterium]|nr:PepSY-associated TM helix domain-containing protein [Hyphomonadaceae bacterium]